MLKMEDYPYLSECIKFHGHLCPGLSLGYKASIIAMEEMKVKKLEDEIVAIVENDSCFVDSVQVITGCTLGKGNLIIKDHGKMVLNVLSRKTKKGLRVALRYGSPFFLLLDDVLPLADKVFSGCATCEEKERFFTLQKERAYKVLKASIDELFSVRVVEFEIPPFARIVRSEPCSVCNEPVMVLKMETKDGKRVCKVCALALEERNL
ncbi:MAG: FmdE family protein [Desulfobacterota bacterium]|nr:FmdE family protein [Thermodesulfobacteriota bacterium]MDW8001459.1 FmdE family protein [Deltaproteobacteria bacterium]